MIAIVRLSHPVLAILFALIGTIFLPATSLWMKDQFHFALTMLVKIIMGGILLIISIPLFQHYQTIDRKEEYERNILLAKQNAERLAAEEKDRERKDSLSRYMGLASQFEKKLKIPEALNSLIHASNFSVSEIEKNEVIKAKAHILGTKAIGMIKQQKFKTVIPDLSYIISIDPDNSDMFYYRAVCYSKTGKTKEAVDDLKQLIGSENKDAVKLYEKLNPIRRRIIGYETLCCDGTISHARGRGACSHHGGVCNWNKPVYEEYRKYE